ncbi:MAG: ABC transporter permease [Cytophagales bacterium]|nr:ABC transporter permease [Cytophagales bacterium]
MGKIVVDANKSKLSLGLRELFQYKDLFITLAYRDLRVRYAQTILGFIWAFVQPLSSLLIFTFVFNKVIKVDTGDAPYQIFAMSGMISWTYFAFVLNQSGNSIIGAQGMVKKIYFPRLIIPLSKAVVGFVDFGIAFLLMIGLMIYFQYIPSSNIIYLPIFILLTVISALAVGIWVSVLTIRYRDFQHIVPFIVQFGLYATPIGYTTSTAVDKLPKWLSIIYYLNPIAGIIDGVRWSILGTEAPNQYAYISFSIVIIIFISGLFYFKKVEKVMADIV